MINKAIVWFRNDLRVHDNEALSEALRMADEVIPVFVFDERIFGPKTSFGFEKTGVKRTQFIIECVEDLRSSIENLGSSLIVRTGITEDIIFDLSTQLKASWVFCNRERTSEEVAVQDALEKKLWTQGMEMRYSRGKMLYYTSDLPFPITHTPDTFTSFRKEVEKYVPVRVPLPSPISLAAVDKSIESGDIPSLLDFGFEESTAVDTPNFHGGETAALAQLDYYLWKSDNVAKYKKTRNEMLGWDYSSKLSPYLAQGCISPKTIYDEVKKYESQRTKNDSTYWLVFELLWRDFFRLIGKKYGDKIFVSNGISEEETPQWSTDRTLFNIWAQARTGVPMIDANMRELNATGFMSNRGRQNVASFLVNDMKVHWLLGAEYFESMLLDYDPCSNYGNWNYIAGVGVDPRPDRWFNVVHQGKRYDSKGEHAHHWLPELDVISGCKVHDLPIMSKAEMEGYNIILGKDYPKAVVIDKRWA